MASGTEGSVHEESTRVDRHASTPSAELAPASLGAVRRGALDSWLEDEVQHGLGARLGRFALLRVLGRGGMGVVFAGYDEELDRKVAIKLLRTPTSGSPLDREVLRNEARAMARLSHPNIVQVYDVGEFEGQLFVAMEFVAGQSLREWMRHARRGWREVVDMCIQAGKGLQGAHEAGIVHCDFKPANVLVGDDGRARVLDFGLAQRRQDDRRDLGPEHSHNSWTGGTPSYMAPELHMGAAPDVRSDQFAFCVALYEGLFGVRPFQAPDHAQLRAVICAGQPAPPPAEDRTPTWLRRVVLRGLSPAPGDRWPSMQALLAELGRDRVRARRRWLIGGGAVGLVGLLGLGGWQGHAAMKAAERARCSRPEQELVEALGTAARAAARQAIRATGVDHAERSVATVDAAVDDFVARSIAVHAAACDGAILEGTLSADMLALRERCAAHQRDEVRAALDVFEGADASVVDNIHRIVDYFPAPERCGDLRHLAEFSAEARVGHPRREAIRAALPRVRAAWRVGRYAEAERLLEPLVAEVERTEDRGLRADVFAEAARNAHDRGAYEESERLRMIGFADALAVGDAEASAWLAIDTIGDELFRKGRSAEASRWITIAEGLVARTGTDDLTFELTHYRSGLASLTRDHAGALALYDQGLALAERQGRSLRSRAALQNNRGIALLFLGRHDEARVAHETALADLRTALGDGHPDVAATQGNIGLVHLHAGELASAQAVYRDALAATERLLAPTHPGLAIALLNLVSVEIELGNLDDAHALATRARAILAAQDPPAELLLGYVDVALGDVERRRGELDQGEARCTASLAALERNLGADHVHLLYPLLCLGELALARGRGVEARERLERALRLAGDGLDITRADRGHVRQALARALAAGGETERARRLADEALAAYAEAGEAYAGRRRDLEAWRARLADPGAPESDVQKVRSKRPG